MNPADTLYPLKVQWRSEHRIVCGEIQRLKRRKDELEEMLESFFGEDWAMPFRPAPLQAEPVVSALRASVAIAEDGQ